MPQTLTIDTSTLTKSALDFGESMAGFLETELEYIEYLRGRNGGGTGVGGLSGERGDETQFDYAKKYKRDVNFSLPYFRRRRLKNTKKPKGYLKTKAQRTRLMRSQRNTVSKLTKLGLRGDQIKRFRELRAAGVSTSEALDIARKSKVNMNVVKSTLQAAQDVIPNRPAFLKPDLVLDAAKTKGKEILKPVLTKVDDIGKSIAMNSPEILAKALPALKTFYKTGAGKFIKRIPFGVGALIDFVILTTIFGEPAGRAAFKAAGGTLGAWLGGLAGTAGGAAIGGVGAVIAGPAGAIAGGLAGDWLGGVIYDATLGKENDELGDDSDPNRNINKLKSDSSLAFYSKGGVASGASSLGAVVTSTTRGMFGGMRAVVGEANEAEIILPMSKIGDAISAVYREGASIMVGATIAFLGPLSNGNPAAAKILSEARRIAQITGADTDIKPEKITLPETEGSKTTNTTSSTTILENGSTAVGGDDSSTSTNKITKISGQDRWKTILPKGDPLFSSPFGPRWGRMHRGIDIGVWEDSPVHAQEDGVVEQIIPKFGEYGGAVVVSHQDGTANLYGHVYDYVVETGQKVKRGDQLAKIQYYPGKDGSNQSHLHFERFNKSGTRIDPLPYFSQGGAPTAPVKETEVKSVNQGGPNLRNISSSFVNIGSQSNQTKQSLIDTPVNISNKTKSTPTIVPMPQPFPVPILKRELVPMEEKEKDVRMVIDVFGKGASRV